MYILRTRSTTMGLQRPKPTGHGGLMSAPPSTPLAVSRALPPVASTVNIHITNHNHFILTPPSTLPNQKHANRFTAVPVQAENASSPLLQRIAPFLSPFYSFLTPAATPKTRTVPVSPLVGPAEKQTEVQVEETHIVLTSEDFEDSQVVIPADEEEDMPFSFSAAAGTRSFADRQAQSESSTVVPSSPPQLHLSTDETEVPASELDSTPITSPLELDFALATAEDSEALRRRGAIPKPKLQPRKRGADARYPHRNRKSIPHCHDHDLRLANEPEGVDVVPCDWVRPHNSQRFNNYTNGDVQCAIPKCDSTDAQTCISTETYGPNSVWARTAPPGQTAESHRLRSRIRYLCSRCPQPAPQPPGGMGPIELCTCVLRDADGIPTDMWFQCGECAESAWFDCDSKFGGPDGVLVSRKKARRRKNKYGVIIRPRLGKGKELVEWRVKRCTCGRIAPSDGRYGAWCTWCMCPVDGVRGMELGGAATRSGVAFLQDGEVKEGKRVKKLRVGDEDGEDSGIGM
ncbi:hypothetical protein Dda_8924 [Drechslerella dactyloides]|uniref:Uncharacterized protein n=1 Tax=Drechslerella dactyloides TaxID=74499 RepID=A0AAD6IQB1_DREDA|nr:hypothetical protein Dda_8924 [Drechslerella dactyloides]